MNDEIKIKETKEENIKDNNSNNKEKDVCEYKEPSMNKILIKFLKDFLKYFSLRSIYSIIQLILTKKKFNLVVNQLQQSIFSIANLKTSLFVSLIPLLFSLLRKVFGSNGKGIFLSGFISGYLAILVEEKTPMVKFIVISIFVRLLHSIAVKVNSNSQYDIPYISYEFLTFLISSIVMVYLSFIFPQFTGITKAIDVYGNFTNSDKHQMHKLRNIAKIF